MTRCGCGSSCSCLIIESDSLIITGDGDQTSGYKGDLRLDPASPSPLVITPAGLSVNGTLPDLTGAITATAGSSVTAFGTENLPTANLNSGTDASSSTYWRGDGTWAIPPGSGGGSIPSLTGAINYTSGTTTTSFGTDSLPTANLNSGTGASAYTYWRGDGTWSVPGGAALSAYSAGALSGLSGNSVSSWTINIGGITGVQDVAIFKNPAGESQAYTGTAGVSLSFVIGGAPGTVGHSRTDALVIYKDPLGTPAYQVVAGTSATTGTQVPPNDAAIRGAIPSGSLKFVTVVGYVTIAYGASSVSLGNLVMNYSRLDYRVRQDYQLAQIYTSQSTNAGGPVDLATVGPIISLNIGASGKAHIQYSVMTIATALGVAGRNFAFLNLDITGATTATNALWNTGINNESSWTGSGIHHSFLVTSLNPGINIFKLRYGATGGTYSFYNRQISGYAI